MTNENTAHSGHDHAGHEDHADRDHSGHDHAGHDHSGHEDHAGHDHAGHEDHAGHAGHDHSAHDPAQFRNKFWITLALTIPTMVFSMGLQDILGLSGPRFPGSELIPAAFGTAVFFYGGLVFLRGAVAELRAKSPGMMTLISLAILVAFGYSIAVTFGLHGMDFWWELGTLITIMLLGHWIEMTAVMNTQNALGALAKLLPDQAEIWHEGQWMLMPVAEAGVGARVLVRPGSAVPVDGVIIEGESDLDESLLTGESAAVDKGVGDTVVAGSINGSGALTIEVAKTGEATALAGIMRLVEQAQLSRSPAQLLADRAAALLFYFAVGAAVLTAIAWSLLSPDDPSFVLERVVTVLVIACPHALGLAVPLVAQISTTLGARNGILVRERTALEQARLIDVVLFDKTGTLTEGRQGVYKVVASVRRDSASGVGGTPAGSAPTDEDPTAAKREMLRLAAGVEQNAEHPIARAIVAAAVEAGVTVPPSSSFEALAGRGATAVVDGHRVEVVSQRVLNERAITPDAALMDSVDEAAETGKGVVFVLRENEVLGLIALADVIRPESKQAVDLLRQRGIRVAMLTGDSQAVGAWVAGQLGISEVFAEVLPGSKAEIVQRLQRDGSRVAMVGDGINDAPALSQADIGIAIGAGTDVAIESAAIVLASSDPRGVSELVILSQATYRKMQQNLFWATGYNVIGIPLAAGVLAFAGILLSPALGAALMSISTVVVALNAQLLRRLRLSAETVESTADSPARQPESVA